MKFRPKLVTEADTYIFYENETTWYVYEQRKLAEITFIVNTPLTYLQSMYWPG